jgi:tripartite ATP-independent transporter DctM subunit
MQLTVMLILSISFSVFLVLGVPISVCLALASFLSLLPLYDPLMAAQVIGHSFVSSLDNFGFLAIPFFVLAGQIMNVGGVARRLINFAKVVAGPLPGGLAYCNVLANFLFGAVTGSAVASAAAVGSAMAPAQKREGYDPAFTAAVNIASSCTGLLTPPSNSLILYALISGGTSVIALFVAGYVPAFLMAAAVLGVIAWKSKEMPRGDASSWNPRNLLSSFIDSLPSLFLIVLVMGGLIAGVFTPTEASTVSVLYALFLGFMYKELKLKDLPHIIVKSVLTASVVLFLVAASSAMSWVFSITQIPVFVAEAMLSVSSEPWMLLLMMNIIMLLMGTFMDITPAILIFTPIFLPVALKAGIDPIHFGIVIVFNNCIGILTPPVGSSLFVGSGVSGVSLEKIMPKLMPMFYAECVMLALVTFVPELSLWLPKFLGLM